MKTFLITLLKIAVVALVFWWLLHNAPALIMPVIGAFVLAVVLTGIGALAAVVGLGVGLTVIVALLGVAFAVMAALTPLWLPVLAIVGLVALCRPKRGNGNPPPTPTAAV
ncbi:hypothetical protein [Actomonas aquatica]|uniref:Phage holin family protein n=1 Tax=Actomonas aquatica TaxID=2866162 RepID=A0ABZ1CE41_9BACT|nr:hypothetical protein [Opitutus sp. WL0086]WRQ89952.1 hypothetical protein K1X11_011085 [Opitutus sp. WL0086]